MTRAAAACRTGKLTNSRWMPAFGETNSGATSLAAPKAASSRPAKYSFSAASGLGIKRLLPFRARNRTLLVGIRPNQACVDREPFSTDDTSRNAPLDHTLEHAAKNLALTEAFVPAARDRQVIPASVLAAQAG